MRMNKKYRLLVLGFLSENLGNANANVVNVEALSKYMQLSSQETRELLLKMDQDGEIQVDIECRYLLITKSGLSKHRTFAGNHLENL